MNNTWFFRLLHWNLRSWLCWWYLPAAGALFIFTGWRSAVEAAGLARSVPTAANVWDAFFVSFAGPDAWNPASPEALAWLASHLLFFYLIGDLANGELLQRGYTVVPLIGSRRRWWWGKAGALLLISIGYALLGLLAALVGSMARLPWSWRGSGLLAALLPSWPDSLGVAALCGWTFLLVCSTLFAMAGLQMVLSILWRRSFHGLIAISLITMLSWLMGVGNPRLIRWLPGSQSALLRHTLFDVAVPGFPLAWSLVYNAILSMAVLGLGLWCVRRMDILGQSEAR